MAHYYYGGPCPPYKTGGWEVNRDRAEVIGGSISDVMQLPDIGGSIAVLYSCGMRRVADWQYERVFRHDGFIDFFVENPKNLDTLTESLRSANLLKK